MEQRKFIRQVRRLTTEQLKVKEVVASHQAFMKERQERLDELAKEFSKCRASLALLEPTPDNLLALWKKSELFKEELLEVAELLNEYFRRSNKRSQRTNDAIVRLEDLASRKVQSTCSSPNATEEDRLLSNPFHY